MIRSEVVRLPVTRWRCKVCGYIHEGPEPPDLCPVCGAPKSEFEPVSPEKEERVDPSGASAAPVAPLGTSPEGIAVALGTISYGLFVVSSKRDGRFNAQTANTVFQITNQPTRIALGINKKNLTHEYIQASGEVAVTVLGRGNMGLVKRFGFQSGRTVDKFAGIGYSTGPQTGCPVLPGGVAYLEARVIPEMSVDVGTHTLFVADVIGGGALKGVDPITYDYYRQNRSKPEDLVDDVDLQNAVAALNQEFGANRRYEYQIKEFNLPRIGSVLEGVRRTEADHVDNNLAYVEKRLGRGSKGWARVLTHLRLNLEFEETARDTYARFARAADDPQLKEMFLEQSRSEMGHVKIFQSLIQDIENGKTAVVFYCPVCGWEVDFGTEPDENNQAVCPKCGVELRLNLVNGNWQIEMVD